MSYANRNPLMWLAQGSCTKLLIFTTRGDGDLTLPKPVRSVILASNGQESGECRKKCLSVRKIPLAEAG